jgi:hypothetical protein
VAAVVVELEDEVAVLGAVEDEAACLPPPPRQAARPTVTTITTAVFFVRPRTRAIVMRPIGRTITVPMMVDLLGRDS